MQFNPNVCIYTINNYKLIQKKKKKIQNIIYNVCNHTISYTVVY